MDKIYIITYNHNDDEGLIESLPVIRFGYFLKEEDAIAKARQLNKSIPQEMWNKYNDCYSHTTLLPAKKEA